MSPPTEPCPLCGALAEPPRIPMRDEPWACSPYRAERAGDVEVTLPQTVDPSHVVRRTNLASWAIHMAVRVWADALRQSAQAAEALLWELEARPPEEAVAEVVMGRPAVGSLEAPRTSPGTLRLTGVAPEIARRIVETVPLAEGPKLSEIQIAELAAELAGRESV